MNDQDTICALATANGIGAIAVIRVSGSSSWEIVSALFSKTLNNKEGHTVHFGTIRDKENELIDEVLVTLFEAGKSFTGEESVEISCHGSSYIIQKITAALVNNGCRIANPGEYTQRAFLNGKMDLSQAEAVADLISSQSKASHSLALKQLRGNFSNELKQIREKLINFASLIELELDFAEEDVEFADRSELKQMVIEVIDILKRLAGSFELGNAIKKGVPVAIVGAPNTGKSTLLNQLLGDDRAIVSDIAGTTRDVIEEVINIKGVLFRLIDTAGIRDGAKDIEAIGIEKTFDKIDKASIVLCMADATSKSNIEEVVSWSKELKTKHPEKKVITVINKVDVGQVEGNSGILISAKDGLNLAELQESLVEAISGDYNLTDETIITNARHHEAILKTIEMLYKAKNGLEQGTSSDFVAMDIRQAMYYLGGITGEISSDELLGNIFSNFCIGK